ITIDDILPPELAYNTPPIAFAFDKDGISIPLITNPNLTFTISSLTENNIAIIIYEVQVDSGVSPCVDITNIATITSWSNIPGGDNFVDTLGLIRESSSDITIFDIAMLFTLTSTSNPDTTGINVTLGEVANYTATFTFPELVT